ncbi:hypothetical protein THER_0822 [Thermodesulfovibrio sp. N1]|nr:hypothetical protein THER_0822 [Thermodesulfovibrio sp. N1]
MRVNLTYKEENKRREVNIGNNSFIPAGFDGQVQHDIIE